MRRDGPQLGRDGVVARSGEIKVKIVAEPDLNIEAAKRCLSALGARWRADWSDFDGRTLRYQLDQIAAVLDANDPADVKALADEFVELQEEAEAY